MSSYVEETLVAGETILYEAKTSLWSQLWLILLGFIFFFMFGAGIIFWIIAFIKYKTTELSFTNRRVVAKIGLIGRQTIELNINKVESLQVRQGMFGRIFDYGTLVIAGAGNPQAPISGISAPMKFRQAFMEYQNAAPEQAAGNNLPFSASTSTFTTAPVVNTQIAADSKIFCSECGVGNNATSRFCSGCGAALAR